MERTLLTSLVVVTSVCAYLFSTAVGNYPNIGWRAPAWNNTKQWSYNNNAYMKQNNTNLYYPDQNQHYSQDSNTASSWHPTEASSTEPNPRILLYAKVFDDGYNYIWGHRVKNDKILFYDRQVTFNYADKLKVRDIYYPHGERRHAGTISCIRIIGLRSLWTTWGGHAEIVQGGIGHSNVTIRFTPRGKEGYHFNIYIYGVPFPDYDPFWHRRIITRPTTSFSKDNPIYIRSEDYDNME